MLKIERDKLLIGFVLVIVISLDMISTSMLSQVLPSIPALLPLVVILMLALRFRSIRQYSLSFLFFAPMLLIAGAAVFYSTGSMNFLMYMMLLVFLYKADMESVLKLYLLVAGSFVAVIVLLSLLGGLPNLQFSQYRSAGIVVRNSFGFIYPTDFAAHCFYLFTAFSYIFRRRWIWLRTLLGLGLAYIIIRYCDARLNAASILAVTAIFFYFHLRKNKGSKLLALLPLSAGLASSAMFYLSSHFSWSEPVYVFLNNLFSMRLHLGNEALKKYPIKLFGTRGISFLGYGGRTESVLSYDYVDSSYIQMLLRYGLVPVVLLVILYIFLSWKIYRRKDYLLLSALSLIAVNCMFEAFWVRPSYNIFIFVLFAALPALDPGDKKVKESPSS